MAGVIIQMISKSKTNSTGKIQMISKGKQQKK
jgi:hypothetical protein